MAHKKYFDLVERSYQANKSRYDSIEDTKNTLDSNLEKYVSQQISLDRSYLVENVSIYAEKSYEYAKTVLKKNIMNEIIAETIARKGSSDVQLNKLIRKELNYGRYDANGYSSSSD
ncbi:hypothetical protein [uncultured Lactobacillus sp.]|uniref:hypothetical protein n=1 Tax=uncultured Lactobacillus sp. TaxID=153152 RepID=UPI002614D955|nr:hypothetical protein [uncultured Lactobacillus sp.]